MSSGRLLEQLPVVRSSPEHPRAEQRLDERRLTRACWARHSAWAPGPTRFATARAAATGTPAAWQAAKTPPSSRCSAAATPAERRALRPPSA